MTVTLSWQVAHLDTRRTLPLEGELRRLPQHIGPLVQPRGHPRRKDVVQTCAIVPLDCCAHLGARGAELAHDGIEHRRRRLGRATLESKDEEGEGVVVVRELAKELRLRRHVKAALPLLQLAL